MLYYNISFVSGLIESLDIVGVYFEGCVNFSFILKTLMSIEIAYEEYDRKKVIIIRN